MPCGLFLFQILKDIYSLYPMIYSMSMPPMTWITETLLDWVTMAHVVQLAFQWLRVFGSNPAMWVQSFYRMWFNSIHLLPLWPFCQILEPIVADQSKSLPISGLLYACSYVDSDGDARFHKVKGRRHWGSLALSMTERIRLSAGEEVIKRAPVRAGRCVNINWSCSSSEAKRQWLNSHITIAGSK